MNTHYKLIENALSKDEVEYLSNYFFNNEHLHVLHSNHMLKITKPWERDEVRSFLTPILSKYFDVENAKNLGDNFYKHSAPYFPHVDLYGGEYPCINCVIPLYLSNGLPQSFVIFDQYITEYVGRTWLGEYESKVNYVANKSAGFPFKDSSVKGLTNKDIDDSLYTAHLESEYRPEELYYGMSGTAIDWKPGDLIFFDSKYIHASAKIKNDFKLGLSLRFAVDIKDIRD